MSFIILAVMVSGGVCMWTSLRYVNELEGKLKQAEGEIDEARINASRKDGRIASLEEALKNQCALSRKLDAQIEADANRAQQIINRQAAELLELKRLSA